MSDVLLLAMAAVLLVLSGSFSGLNIGLMMARPDDLRRKARQGDAIATRVYRYRKDGYYLIFCILLGNVGVNTAMSILLGNMTNGVIGGLIATLLITMFGEILPQAIFTQRGYRFVRHFFWLLDVIYVLFWPLAKPMSKLLNRWLGKETPQLYSHQELEQIIHEHAERSDSPVDYDESRIAAGALQFSKKTAGDLVTPMSEVFTVNLDDELDATLLAQIKHAGHSRIPVQSDGTFVGLLYVKDLVGQELPLPVSQVYHDKIHDIDARSHLDTVLSRFIQTRSHLFVVVDPEDQQMGIITLEDVIEEILKQEIEDEFDSEI
mgnify:FL=1